MYIKTINECTPRELADFEWLEAEGNTVPRVQLERVKLIGFYYEGDELIATRALKKPYLGYKVGLFRRAQMERFHVYYSWESGYSYTVPRFRQNGLSTILLRALINHRAAWPHNIYATTLMHNTPVIKVFLRVNGKPIGRPFCSPSGMVMVLRLK